MEISSKDKALIGIHMQTIDEANAKMDKLNREICDRYALWNEQYELVKQAKAEIAKLV